MCIQGFKAHGQSVDSLSITNAYQWARTNYPLTKERDLITKTKAYTVANVAKSYLPLFNHLYICHYLPAGYPGFRIVIIHLRPNTTTINAGIVFGYHNFQSVKRPVPPH